ncbi:hypothetical protein GCM10010520_12330 [Rhizobium viscosum]|uniref:Phenylacetate-CoA ligase n=1 Tax=Rhizobium viscosum TaxID=1673 RepID=A0ABR9IYT2_RHIVS|nr:hypothetical protein [Rhizobium viscosum]MBE1508223.1 phenylacetate-CoA ligase [Rhizobium viscosum]
MLLVTEDATIATSAIGDAAKRFNYSLPSENSTTNGASALSGMISQLPISTKESLIAFRNENANTYLSEALLFAETSGTTGAPLQIPRTRTDLINGVRNYIEAYGTVVRSGEDRVAFIHPSILSPLRDLTVRALQDLSVGVMTLFPIPGLCGYERIHHILSQNRVTTLLTSPSIVYQILFNFDRLGLKLPGSVNQILVTGEYFSEASATNIKRLIDRECRIAPIIYGANEIGMMMYAERDFSYRAIARDFVFECMPLEVETDYVDSVAPGSKIGELLVTGLTPTIMPIVRYATRDVFNFIPGADGSWTFRHLGRKDDFPIKLVKRNKIDDLLYSLETPIFHYILQYAPSEATASIELLLPASDLPNRFQEETADKIADIIGTDTRVTVDTENYDGGFVQGQCVSKVSRFNLAA